MKQFARITLATLALASVSLVQPAAAQQWPAQNIRIVVPFAAGGTTDILGRLVAENLGKHLNTTGIVENAPGANGNIGAALVARSKPDGYTLLLGTPGPMIVNRYVYDNLTYDSKTAFAPIAVVAALPNVLMVRPNLGVNSAKELVALMKKTPGAVTHGSPGVGSSGHISTELFKMQANVEAIHAPYKGSLPMLTDLMGGSTDFTIDQISSSLKMIQAGSLKALAVTSKTRSPELPNVPTMIEAGFPDYEVSVWFCLAAPAGTPQKVINQINAALNKALADPVVKAKIVSYGAQPVGGSPEDLRRQIASEEKIISTVVKKVNLKN